MPTREEELTEKIQELTLNVRDKINIIDKVNSELKELRITVTKLRRELDHCATERDIFREQAKESTAKLEKCKTDLVQLEQIKEEYLQNSLNKIRDDYERQIKDISAENNNLKNEINTHEKMIVDLEYEASQLKQRLDESQKKLSSSQQEFKKATDEITDQKSLISALNSALQTKDENISILKDELIEKSQKLENASHELDRKKLELEDLGNVLKKKKMELAQSKNDSKSLTTDLSNKIEDYITANRILILQIDRMKKYLDETDDKVKILRILEENNQGMSKIGITGALGLSPRVVQEYLDELNQRQFIELSQDGRAIFKKFPWT
ncbi:MAG: hypothetical protein ACTSP4_06265 [Candidatus Hodarchaeales archaeon]